MPTSTVNGVKLFWELTGDSGEPLVFVHGSWLDHHVWDAVVPLLSSNFRVLTYDRRGHSQSERPATPGSILEDVADLAALIETLQLAPAHIVGYSLGGAIVLRLGSKRPDLFRSLMVHEPPLFNLLDNVPNGEVMLETIGARIAAVKALLEAGDMEEGAKQFIETIAFGSGAWTQLPPGVKQTAIFNAPTVLATMRDPEARSFDLARLRNFSKPLLLTLGEGSPPVFPLVVEQMAKMLPQAQRKTFLGAGHEPQQSHPEEFAATIIEFISRLTQPVVEFQGSD